MGKQGKAAIVSPAARASSTSVSTGASNGTSIEVRDDKERNALMVASEKGQLTVLSEMLSHNADPDIADQDGWTALIAATVEGHVSTVKTLLDHGAKINLADSNSWTALTWTCYLGYTDIARELLSRGADANHRSQYDFTPLFWASGRGHLDIARLLLQYGARADTADKFGNTPLIWACRKGRIEIAWLLIDHGVNINKAGAKGSTALCLAAKGGYVELADLLVRNKADVNITDQEGSSPLALAVAGNHTGVVDIFLNAGAYTGNTNKDGETVLVTASKSGNKDIVHKLILKHASIDAVDSEGRSALFHAVDRGHTEVVSCLLEHGANPNIKNKNGETPLICGARRKHTHCIRVLLENSADVNATNKRGDTALHIAVAAQYRGICETILKDQKNLRLLYLRNKTGETPLSTEKKQGSQILSPIIKKWYPRSQIAAVGCQPSLDLHSKALAELLTDTTLDLPLTVGLFARWGSEKTHLLKDIQAETGQLAFHDQMPILKLGALGVTSIIFLISTIGMTVYGITGKWLHAVVATSVLSGLVSIICAVIYVSSLKSRKHSRWSSASSFAQRMQNFALVGQLIFSLPPDTDTAYALYPVKFVYISLSRLTLSGGVLATLTYLIREIKVAFVKEYGVFFVKLFSLFNPKHSSMHKQGNMTSENRWRSICYIPYIAFYVLAVLCLWTCLVLVGFFGVRKNTISDVFNLICVSYCGLVLLLSLNPMFRSVCRIFRSSSRAGLSGGLDHSGPSDYALMKFKQEVNMMVQMLVCADAFRRRQTRVIISLDCLDRLEQEKVLQVLDVINIVIGSPNYPFIILVAADPHLLSLAIQRNFDDVSDTNSSSEYLRNVIDLPMYVDDMDTFSGGDDCSSSRLDNHTDVDGPNTVAANGNDDLSGPLLEEDASFHHTTVKAVPIVGLFDVSSILKACSFTGTASQVKRTVRVVSIYSRMFSIKGMPYCGKSLTVWVALLDNWPCWSSIIHIVCDQRRQKIPLNTSLLSLHHSLNLSRYWENRIAVLDRDPAQLESFLVSTKDVITIGDVWRYSAYCFHVDPIIKQVLLELYQPQNLRLFGNNANTLHGRFSVSQVCSDPMSMLKGLSVDQVCQEISAIEGLDPKGVQIYQSVIVANNISGKVLATCDLIDLKEVLGMTFGDWHLFKLWLLSYRGADSGQRSQPLVSSDPRPALPVYKYQAPPPLVPSLLQHCSWNRARNHHYLVGGGAALGLGDTGHFQLPRDLRDTGHMTHPPRLLQVAAADSSSRRLPELFSLPRTGSTMVNGRGGIAAVQRGNDGGKSKDFELLELPLPKTRPLERLDFVDGPCGSLASENVKSKYYRNPEA